ncbi:nucleolar protein 14-like isoform X2 [Pomacea canaliculata]|uniref:nucleolar protein 14-like isoform X2 n=1 Tax=Pomacea canaliculata TaxID=400727 RepID=UPI000D72C457|nr:nucleolar protein 14-like isoform X2 [Pomacea canaliculata]
MGKKKNNADKVRNRTSASKEKKLNPFEFKINRQKHFVVGRNNHNTGQVGKPGQSRSKANKRRMQTLLVELKQSGKANVFRDQRLGEKNPSLSAEEKAIQRFALERKSQNQRKGLLEIGEEEELTHYGQSLADIEKFEDPIDDSDLEEDGRISGKMVADEHFGGFLTHKSETSEKKSWKERMGELILQTRKEKMERQTEKDNVARQTEELDKEWKATVLPSRKEDKKIVDDYDIAVNMLRFETKGKPSDRLKTEEELAKEEAERLQRLEADRKRRMMGESDISSVHSTHVSADSLEDSTFGNKLSLPRKVQYQENEENDGSDNDDDDNKEENKDEDDDSDDNEDDDDDDDDDDNDDLSSDEEDEEEEAAQKVLEAFLIKKAEKEQGAIKSILKKRPVSEEQKKVAEAAKKELPYTFEAPENYEGLLSLLADLSIDQQLLVIERLYACHHPSLAEGNKQKLEQLFSQLLQYLMDSMAQEDPVQLFDSMTATLYKLMKHNPDSGASAVLQLLLNRHEEFQQICQRRSGRGKYMGLDTMLLLKLIHVLFPTSDFRHPVVTPAFYFITSMLGQSPVQNEGDVAAGLFLCVLSLEYVAESSRFIPEAINFLHGLLFMAAEKDPNKEKVFPPFKPVGPNVDLLKIDQDFQGDIPALSISRTLGAGVQKQTLDTDDFRVSAISTTVRLLQEFSHLYHKLPAAVQVFAPIRIMLNKLPIKKYPTALQESIKKLSSTLEKDSHMKVLPLTMEKKKPQPLRQFEPRVEEVFDGKKKRKGNREFQEKQRLQHKLKREYKGALREIRKDSRFLAKQQLKETLELDSERKRKLNRLYADLALQEGDFKALKRQKNKS